MQGEYISNLPFVKHLLIFKTLHIFQELVEDKLDLWLISGAERFRRDPELCQALLTLAQNKDSRRCLLLLEAVLETPSLAVMRPKVGGRTMAVWYWTLA